MQPSLLVLYIIAMFYCGTSGFSYDDWSGIFYPSRLPRKDWLNYYAQEFNALELNTTYYALPSISMMESLVRKTPDGFIFVVKANQEMTHKRKLGKEVANAFIRGLRPLIDAGRLGCVLAQFPYSFLKNAENQSYLDEFHGWMEEISLVIEFRNSAWLDPAVLDWMRQRKIGFCCVDEPPLPRLLPPVAYVTADIGYVRFHGRNQSKWWNHAQPWERYDYTYTDKELQGWIPKIQQISQTAARTFIFANNHWKSQAVDTIRRVRGMLDQLVL